MHGRRHPQIRVAGLLGLAAIAVGACTTSQSSDTTGRVLVGQGQFRFYSCDQLAALATTYEKRQRELLALIAKANQGPGGSLVSTLSYEPDLAVARGQLAEVRREQAEKKCPPATPTRPTLPVRRS
ncbi:MAG: hypothetical protein AB7O50_10385 [Pseudolabrys sp.]